jgi:hypothetical protein
LEDSRVNLFTNIEIGKNLEVAKLKDLYSCLICANGAALDKDIELPSSHPKINGVFTASQLVKW